MKVNFGLFELDFVFSKEQPTMTSITTGTLRQELQAKIAAAEQDFALVETRAKAEITALKTELGLLESKVAGVLDTPLADLRNLINVIEKHL